MCYAHFALHDSFLSNLVVILDKFKTYDGMENLEVEEQFAAAGITLQSREDTNGEGQLTLGNKEPHIKAHHSVNHTTNFVTPKKPTDPLYKLIHTQVCLKEIS